MIKNEIRLANIKESDKILHIGSGPIPATSIILTKKTNVNITAIDKSKNSVKQSTKLIKRLNLSEKIKIINSDILDFSLNEFDLIIVAQGINPYENTLKYISKSLKKSGRVIFRTSSTTEGHIAEKDLFLNDLFIISKIIAQKKNGLLISLLLLKK